MRRSRTLAQPHLNGLSSDVLTKARCMIKRCRVSRHPLMGRTGGGFCTLHRAYTLESRRTATLAKAALLEILTYLMYLESLYA